MNTVKPTKKTYNSTLRSEQAHLTKTKIQEALLELFQSNGSAEEITYKEVARRAGVTEMTVYRHFPDRENLLKVLWEGITEKLGAQLTMPTTADELLRNHDDLIQGFGANEAMIVASITTAQGREMRASINQERMRAFTNIVKGLNPRIPPRSARSYAAVLQLLHSAYAWDSLRCRWDMTDKEISKATKTAIEVLFDHIKRSEK